MEPMPYSPLHTAAEIPESDPENLHATDSDESDMETLSITNDTLQTHIASLDRSPTTPSPAGNKHTEGEILPKAVIYESEETWRLIGRLQSNFIQQSKLYADDSILNVVDSPGFVNGVEELEHIMVSLLNFATSQIFPHWLRECVGYNFVRKVPSQTTQNDVKRLRFFQSRNSRPFESSYDLVVDLLAPSFPLRKSELGPLFGICIHHIIHGYFHILPNHSKGTHEKPFLAIVHNINAWILGLGFTRIEVPLTCNFKVVSARIYTPRRSLLRGLQLPCSGRGVPRT
jgi:hypothetical protein